MFIKVMFIFFFKQKTAYEIYQCDWSSDVCSSDLDQCKNISRQQDKARLKELGTQENIDDHAHYPHRNTSKDTRQFFPKPPRRLHDIKTLKRKHHQDNNQIGRASCRERV